MRKLEKLDKYVITPNVGFYGGFKWDGEDIFLCDDCDTDTGYECRVTQKIENGKLITDLVKKYEHKPGKIVTENSHMEVEIDKDQLLVYVEGMGFTISEYKMCTLHEAQEKYELLKGEVRDDDTEADEDNSACTD